MEWIIVAAIGAVIGTIVSYVSQGIHMPQPLTILLAVAGAFAGAILGRVTGFEEMGRWAFYVAAGGLSVGLVAGGMFAFSLTSEERRI